LSRRGSARDYCSAAEAVVTACYSYYFGRERMFLAADQAIHRASLEAHALPRLPPEVRVAQADGDWRAAGGQPRVVNVVSV
jgi:hypothetical protein